MDSLNTMLKNIDELYKLIQNDLFDKNELNKLLNETETLFQALAIEEGYDSSFKDEMIKNLEENAIERLENLKERSKKNTSLSFALEEGKILCDRVRKFWREEGFNYIKDIKVNEMGVIEVEFGFSLDFISSYSEKKTTEKQEAEIRIENLKCDGYRLNRKEKDLVDCDGNKEKIKSLIINRFPSAYIVSWETFLDGKENQRLRYVKVRIRDVNDV